MEKKTYQNIDEYVADFSDEVAALLNQIRQCIKEVVPNAEEVISYNMPAFKQKKVLVYFAAFKNHIGFYALPSGNVAFQEELLKYKVGKGSIQFPLNQPIPFDLIKKIVAFREEEVEHKSNK
ncbi:hypothetical protein EMA8858_02127 [Emticicia aquatica]|jgi:uncharacterized protein YdhG (YjbR/CyaY superfamily)|uniref:YdhG-like domain-containing protein n=1 Tax=Emticicia aquatica TaxID=1681835 RepID=A0ABM9AQ11_9BACT|nr:DUF1801 domain-containing protein [Emticicia aquatica]CAH0995999.1 hypothetical protein EMA8858_02127 [Emticicia aquatica]